MWSVLIYCLGLPILEAPGSLGHRFSWQDEVHSGLDWPGHSVSVLDLWVLLPSSFSHWYTAEFCQEGSHLHWYNHIWLQGLFIKQNLMSHVLYQVPMMGSHAHFLTLCSSTYGVATHCIVFGLPCVQSMYIHCTEDALCRMKLYTLVGRV